MDTNSTIRETESSATIREDSATVREFSSPAPASIGLQQFRGYEVVQQLPSSGGESDIYVVGRGADKFILKLYRYGIEPKIEIINKIVSLSKAHPRELIRVFEFGFDEAEKRWFEIQEYARHGSLRQIIDGIPQFDQERREEVFLAFLREVSNSLKLLHENGILHLDLKPANVLARSLDPIDFVLIDFGISGGLDSELSKRFTAVRGTPMYQAPESWIGAVGEASDWWSLGMAAFEILSGKHPFSGLSQQVIALLLTTKSIEVPETIPPDKRELLRGLLTRDTSMRWGYDQVSRWLSGERGIPVYFETPVPGNAQAHGKSYERRPLSFLGEEHTALETLARVIARDETSWAKGQELLLRGNIRTWLENNEDFEQAVDINLLTEDAADPNEKLFRFVHRYGAPLPFVFMGKLMTLNNLLLFLGRHLKHEEESKAETVIAETLCGGISSLLDFYLLHNEPDEELNALKLILTDIHDEPPQTVFDYLNAIKIIKDSVTSEQFIELCETGVTDEIRVSIFYAARDKDGKTALAYAAANCVKPETFTTLIKAGASVNAKLAEDNTTLSLAIKCNKNPNIIAALLEAGADISLLEAINQICICCTTFTGTKDYRRLKAILVKKLKKKLTDVILIVIAAVVIIFCFYIGIRLGIIANLFFIAVVIIIFSFYIEIRLSTSTAQLKDPNALMFETLCSDRKDVIKMPDENVSPESKLGTLMELLKKGADVNAYGKLKNYNLDRLPYIPWIDDDLETTPLILALARNLSIEIPQFLIDNGADVNARYNIGETPLMAAESVEVAALLIENGADVNAKDKLGRTPLIHAAKERSNSSRKRPDIVSLLIDEGADINAKDNEGMTPLMHVAAEGDIEILSLLLIRGADVNARDNDGKTALSLAESDSVKRLLRSAGGAE